MSRSRQECQLSLLLSNIVLKVPANAIRPEKEMRYKNWKKWNYTILIYRKYCIKPNSLDYATLTNNPKISDLNTVNIYFHISKVHCWSRLLLKAAILHMLIYHFMLFFLWHVHISMCLHKQRIESWKIKQLQLNLLAFTTSAPISLTKKSHVTVPNFKSLEK